MLKVTLVMPMWYVHMIPLVESLSNVQYIQSNSIIVMYKNDH